MTSDSHSADSLLAEADETFQSRNYATALGQYEEVLSLARQEFNRSIETEALSQMARINLVLGRKEEGQKWLEMATARVSENDPMGYSRWLGVRGRFEWKADDLTAARKTFDGLYNFCTVNSLWGRAIDAANMISIVAETPAEQIKWSQRGIEAAEAADEGRWLAILWNNLAGIYYDTQQLDLALESYRKARQYHWLHSGEEAKLFADYHVGMVLRAMSRLDEAASWLRPVLAWAERLDNHSAIGQACEDLGEIELTLGKTTEGLKLLHRAREEYKAAGFDQSWPQIWDNINERIKSAGDQ